mmetsp:Transcript_23754/g.38677  ORF Transcript_23754/g.38677 Transcript_23754/m.38677 type:complete len:253 (-) Transcript_23754:1199-1957(-)
MLGCSNEDSMTVSWTRSSMPIMNFWGSERDIGWRHFIARLRRRERPIVRGADTEPTHIELLKSVVTRLCLRGGRESWDGIKSDTTSAFSLKSSLLLVGSDDLRLSPNLASIILSKSTSGGAEAHLSTSPPLNLASIEVSRSSPPSSSSDEAPPAKLVSMNLSRSSPSSSSSDEAPPPNLALMNLLRSSSYSLSEDFLLEPVLTPDLTLVEDPPPILKTGGRVVLLTGLYSNEDGFDPLPTELPNLARIRSLS